MSRSVWRSTGAIAVAIVLIVSACTPSAASPSAPAPASPGGSPAESGAASPSGSAITGAACQEGATAVDFWTEHTPPASDSLARIVEAFNAANPEICVRMTIVPGSETDIAKLLTAIRGGAAPDVYLADRFTVPQRAAEGVLAELPDAGAMAGDYLEFAWAETQYQGATYALPFDTDARALFYNIDLIEAAGEDASTLDIANGAPTIDEVLAIADAVTTETSAGDYDVLGFLPGGPGPAGQPGDRPGLALHLGLRPRRYVRRCRGLPGDADRPRGSGRFPVPVRLRPGARSRQAHPLGEHECPAQPIGQPAGLRHRQARHGDHG
jgi:ABC-type glycerol-3-phosphate transport system substrate-binding protein